jgi:hypothetical protein
MNTTRLITYWTMDRATRGPDGRFRSVADLRGDLGGPSEEERGALPDVGIHVRGADEDDWQPLPTRLEPAPQGG